MEENAEPAISALRRELGTDYNKAAAVEAAVDMFRYRHLEPQRIERFSDSQMGVYHTVLDILAMIEPEMREAA